MSESRRKLYEVDTSTTEQVGSIERSKATVKSTGSQIYFHRIDKATNLISLEDLFSKINSFCRVRDPRVPMLTDAWEDEGSIEFVLLEQEGVALNSPESRQILKRLNRNFGFEVTYQTLATIAALHDQNATHRHIMKEAFIVHETGLIYLKDHGLLGRINKILNDERDGGDGVTSFQLASNLSGFDVADWACMVASILLGESILDPSHRLERENVEPEAVAMAQKQITKSMNDNAISKFLVKCLQSRADTVGGFDNASDALKAFPVEETMK